MTTLYIHVPPTYEMGSYSSPADDLEDALHQYNDAREHDGLSPVRSLPKGSVLIPYKDLSIWTRQQELRERQRQLGKAATESAKTRQWRM